MSQLPTVGHLIGGKIITTGDRAQDVFNPATGKAEKRVLLIFGLVALAWITRTEPFGGWRAWLGMPGANDAAVITGTSTASLTETDAGLSTGGSLSASDVDFSAYLRR